MALMATLGSGEKTPWVDAPVGTHTGVLCDVQDLGLVENKKFGKMQPKCLIMFQLDSRMELTEAEIEAGKTQGRRHLISKRFTISLDDRGQLLPFIETMLGRGLTKEERSGGFDLETLIGINALVQVVQRPDPYDPDKIWTNIQSCMPNPNVAGHIEVEDYTPKAQREDKDGRPPEKAPVGPPADAALSAQKTRHRGLMSKCRDLKIKTREVPESVMNDAEKLKRVNDQLLKMVQDTEAKASEEVEDDFDVSEETPEPNPAKAKPAQKGPISKAVAARKEAETVGEDDDDDFDDPFADD